MDAPLSLHARIYAMIRQIPAGKVATYGQIARLVGGCSAQMVGFALAGLPEGSGVPWQRVINAQGKISPHGAGYGSIVQEDLLRSEGIEFDLEKRVDLSVFGWLG